MEVFSFLMRSAFPVMALTSRAIICITLLSWAATSIGFFAEAAPAGSGTATCTIPSVREGEEATLTCTYENVNMTGAKAITVNAHGLNISGPGTDGHLSVLGFKKSNTGWQQISLNSNFLLKNGTVISVHNISNVLVTIPKATEGYEGEYSCQLVGRGTPDSQSCHFLLDRVQVDYLNETSVLLYLELQNVSADSRKEKLMQRVDVGLQDAGEIMKENFTLTPPQPNYTVTGLEYNTKYEMIIYQGPAQVPVTRTVCIPTVQSLTTSYVNTSSVRVDWKPSVCDNSIVNHAYRMCYKKVVSEDNCTDSENPFTFINNPDTGAAYEISVQVMIDGKIIGGVTNTTHKAVLKKDTNTQGNGELKAGEIAGIVIGVLIIAAVLVASLIIYLCRSKKLKKETETHDPLDNGKNNGNVAPTTPPRADGQEEIPLLEDMKQELQEERGKCHKLEAEMKLKDAKIRCFEQEKEVADEELQALRRKVDDLTQDINRLKKEKQDADEELQALTQAINRLEKEMQVTEQKLNESQHGLQADMIEIKTLEEQKQKVNEELQSLRERFGKLTMEMRDKENRITSLEQELQETKKELQDMNIKCDKLQEQLNREQRKCQKLQKDAQKLPALKQTCERLARENEKKDTQIQYLEEKQQEREKELQREKEKCFKLASDLQCAEKIKYVEIKHEQEEANRKCRELQHKIEVNNLEIDRLKKEKEEQDRKLAEANRNVMKLTASEATLLERSTQLTHLLKQQEHTRHTQQHTGFGNQDVDVSELNVTVVQTPMFSPLPNRADSDSESESEMYKNFGVVL